MDYWKAVDELQQERQRLQRAITILEGQQRHMQRTARRGRKYMSDAERELVSQRMRAYWEQRKGMSAGADGRASEQDRFPEGFGS